MTEFPDIEPPDGLLVRSMAPSEVDLAVQWAAAEGWNPGRHDAATFHAADPFGFFVAVLDDEPVGTISAVRQSSGYGFVGLYIVAPDLRGRGIGRALWRRGIGRLEAMLTDGEVIGLDAVVAQETAYRNDGFVADHRNLRFEGPAAAWSAPAPIGMELVSAAAVDAADLVALDARHNPAPRPRYLRAWLDQPEARTAVVIGPGGGPVGLAVARPCVAGWKVGPVLAPSVPAAEALVAAVADGLPPDVTVVIDVPEPNAAAVDLARSHGMEVRFETVRMYRGGRPEADPAGLYGVMSLELG